MGLVAGLFGILTVVAFGSTVASLMAYGPKHDNTKYSALLMGFTTAVLIGATLAA
jgi:hypothetical protein